MKECKVLKRWKESGGKKNKMRAERFFLNYEGKIIERWNGTEERRIGRKYKGRRDQIIKE